MPFANRAQFFKVMGQNKTAKGRAICRVLVQGTKGAGSKVMSNKRVLNAQSFSLARLPFSGCQLRCSQQHSNRYHSASCG
jgi:hypothetical protein